MCPVSFLYFTMHLSQKKNIKRFHGIKISQPYRIILEIPLKKTIRKFARRVTKQDLTLSPLALEFGPESILQAN